MISLPEAFEAETAAGLSGSDRPAPRIVITGPTGWIGSALLAYLRSQAGPQWAQSVSLFASGSRKHVGPDGTQIQLSSLKEIRPENLDGAIVIHLAYLTKEKVGVLGERTFTEANLAIDDLVLRALRDARPRGVFVASSGAAALAERGQDRHPYGMCKLRQEDRFLDWSAKAGVPLLAGRIFNLAGPYINKIESYAIGSFAAQARRTGTIRVDANVPVFRSFVHINDLSALVFESMLNAKGYLRAIDLCGSEVLEMGDIAQAVADHIAPDITIVRDRVDWSQPSAYLGNFVDTKILAMEMGIPLTPFYQQVADTLAWMDDMLDTG